MQVIPIAGFPEVKVGDDLPGLVVEALKRAGAELEDGDVLVVAQSVVSKAEGRIVRLEEVEPSERALELAARLGKDGREVELILRESSEIVRLGHVIISRTKHGFVCANAGVDRSNSPPGAATLLPEDPDASAEEICERVKAELGAEVAVVVSDTQGRPFRRGCLGFALGIAGMKPLLDLRGQRDLYGRELRSTLICPADAIAAAAVLVMGEAGEGTPLALVRGARYERGTGSVRELLRSQERDLFG
jgi:coenzyme F420-0:L-glutamate ligase/coenzyme F420-1:gamma-L-glutamate ligase